MYPLIKQIVESKNPSMVMLEKQQEIYTMIPELAKLHGRPQPIQWHPEGSVDEHIRQVIDVAVKLRATRVEVFAALMHDIGKGVTRDDELPKHINHEALGPPIIKKLCERLDIPEDWCKLACLCAKEHLNVHRFLGLRPHKKVDLIDRLGEHVASVALVSEADARGRGPDFECKPYPQREAIIKAAAAINGVSKETPQKTRDAKAKILRELFNDHKK